MIFWIVLFSMMWILGGKIRANIIKRRVARQLFTAGRIPEHRAEHILAAVTVVGFFGFVITVLRFAWEYPG